MSDDNKNLVDWVDAKEGQVFESIFDQLNHEMEQVTDQDQMIMRAINSYLGRRNDTYDRFLYPKTFNNPVDSMNNLCDNVICAAIDTLVAKISEVDVLPKTITNKSTAEGRQLADDINAVVNGLYNKYNIKKMIIGSYRDAMIWRSGYIKLGIDKREQFFIERLYKNEIVIDPVDGYYNNPYKILQKKIVPKTVLLNNYPKFANFINELYPIEIRLGQTNYATVGIVVAEAWCKNTYKKGGRHVMSIQNVDLLDEDWDHDYLPIIKTDFQMPVIGSEGNSVVDIGYSMQIQINKLLQKSEKILRLLASPKVLLDSRSGANPEKWTNAVAEFFLYDGGGGNAPVILNGSALPPEIMKMLEYLTGRFFAQMGLNATDVQGLKPMGIESGEALKTMTQISSARWNQLKEQFTRTHVDVVDLALKMMHGKNIELSSIDNKIGLVKVNTSKLPTNANSYILQTVSQSALPSDPAGRIDTMERYVKLGIVTPEALPDFFNIPDMSEYIALQSAPRQMAQKTIEKIIREKEYIAPEIYDECEIMMQFALKYYSFEKLNEADEEVLVLLRRFINDCKKAIIQQKQEIANASGSTNTGTGNNNQPGVPGAIPGQQPGAQPIPGGLPAAA